MATMTVPTRIEFSDDLKEVRSDLRHLLRLEAPISGKIYAALVQKVWTLLIERRLDADIRDWHHILTGIGAALENRDNSVSERLAGFADLLRESISLSETSPAQELAQRPHAKRILEILTAAHGFVPRRKLMDEIKLKSTYLSNVLSQLQLNNLVERKDAGREAEFRITLRGREIMGHEQPADILEGLGTIRQSRAIHAAMLSSLTLGEALTTHWIGKRESDPVFVPRNFGGFISRNYHSIDRPAIARAALESPFLVEVDRR